jgi:hypothetical protein
MLKRKGIRKVNAGGQFRLGASLKPDINLQSPTPSPSAIQVVSMYTTVGFQGFQMSQLLSAIATNLPHHIDFSDPLILEHIKSAIIHLGGEFKSRFEVEGLNLK